MRAALFAAVLSLAFPALAQNPSTTVNVDAQANRHPINPGIYGVAFATTGDLINLHTSMHRYGGNSSTRYNWQLNADNRGQDWYFESYGDTSSVAGFRGDDFITQTRAAAVGATPMLTIPMINYVGSLGTNRASLRSFSIAKYGAQTGHDPYNSDAGNGISSATGNPITGNNPLDANVANSPALETAWVQHLVNTWGTAANGGLQYYIMDNEPSIWHSTHRDIHPNGQTYDELYNDFVNYAGAVRSLDPTALIAGPEEWGWLGQFFSGFDQQHGAGPANSDYNTHGQMYHYPWLLQQLHAYQQTTGKQLLNVLTVHYYPQDASGGNDDSAATRLVRNKSTRSLWDPTYVDQSWINQVGINGGVVNLIPNLKSWVNQYYPGLQIGITEYNWGDEANLNGATAQADALGIFGREGLDVATRWTVPANPSPTYLAMKIYRNYDGNQATFGDTSVSATVANPDNLSSFAAVRASDGALTVMVINKQSGTTPVNINLANFGTGSTADVWQISSATQTAITHAPSVTVTGNAIATTLPSQSITLFIIPSGNSVSVPTAPTGLTAAGGNGSVTLGWNAVGGATSYTVKRAATSGGPYGNIGTVTSPAPTTFTDSGLTNGTTYYYVVSATNAAGTSPNSAEAAGTPATAATFTSSAVATPNPDNQGVAVSVTATVTCTASSLSNGNVQVMILDPNNNAVVTQNFTGQNFTTGQQHTYTAGVTPALVGNYTVAVGVFTSAWQQLNWNSSAATIVVKGATLSFSSSAMANPTTISPGGTSAIAVKVTDTGTGSLTNGNVELQIFDKNGSAVATQVWGGQNFSGGQMLQYGYNWTSSATQVAGNYTVEIGVFDANWTTNYAWNSNAAVITVSAGQSVPAAPTGLAASGGKNKVSLSWKASTGAASYNVYRGVAAGAESTTPIRTGVTGTSYTDSTVTSGTTYFYKVAAVNSAGTSGLSNEASAKPR